jgi:hypothetical protein
MATSAFRGVELCAVGNWNASKGDGTLTPEDIAAMAAAARDPFADKVPIKIGHTDSRFQDAYGNPPEDQDGHPAYGWVENIRASDDGRTLYGDYVGVPAKLAEVIPSAFRGRSVEFVPGKRLGGKVYRAVLTGLALLGQSAPAVKGLADVMALYSAGSVPVSLSQGAAQETPEDKRERVRRSFFPGYITEHPAAPAVVFTGDPTVRQRIRNSFLPTPL